MGSEMCIRDSAYSQPRGTDRTAKCFDQEGRLELSSLAGIIAARPLAYLCGSASFITTMVDRLVALGLPRFDIFAEIFAAPGEVPPHLEPQQVTVVGTGQSFLWTPAAGSLLDAASAAGVALPSGCRVGQCESCAVRVVEGRFAHMVASSDEPDRCLTCQAVPLSPLMIAI